MKFALKPVKKKPKKNDGGWMTVRSKKPDKYDFKGQYRVDIIERKK